MNSTQKREKERAARRFTSGDAVSFKKGGITLHGVIKAIGGNLYIGNRLVSSRVEFYVDVAGVWYNVFQEDCTSDPKNSTYKYGGKNG
jgi:hypothetical protein